MPQPNSQFQGQTLIVPGAYYADNVSAITNTLAPVTPPLIFIGYGYGQKPKVPSTYTNPTDLLTAIRSGPCSGFVQFLTNPSNQMNGAQVVTFINAANATQSTLAIGTLFTMTSTNYGVPSNLLQATITNGTQVGKKLTLTDSFANTAITGDNLGVPFKLAYTGTATGGLSYTVAVSGLNATSFAVASPNSGESFTISLVAGTYTTVEQVVQYLNGTGFWSAVPLGDATIPSSYLDLASGVSLAASGTGYVYSNVTASLGSFIYYVNQYASSYATAAVSGSVTGYTSGQIPSNLAITSFAGGTSTAPLTADYASALNAALAIPGWTVFVDSGTTAVQSLLSQHVTTASSITNAKYRRGFTGSAAGDSVAVTQANAQALNSFETCYVYPGINRVDSATGINTSFDGLHAAAALAGMATGNQIALPLTNKSLIGTGLEVNLTNSQINQLQQSGVICLTIPSTTGIPTVVSDLTCWQNDSNPANIFTQQVACRWYLAYSILNSLGPFVGTVASSVTLGNVRNAVVAVLNASIFAQGNNGVISSWDPNSLTLQYVGATQTLNVVVNVQLVGQIRFITVFVPIQPLNLTLTSAVTAL